MAIFNSYVQITVVQSSIHSTKKTHKPTTKISSVTTILFEKYLQWRELKTVNKPVKKTNRVWPLSIQNVSIGLATNPIYIRYTLQETQKWLGPIQNQGFVSGFEIWSGDVNHWWKGCHFTWL